MRYGRRVSVRDTFRGSLAAGLEQLDAETAEDPDERRLVESEELGGQGVKSDVAEPFCLHFVLRGTHHARGGVDADDVDVRLSPRQREGRLAGARRVVVFLVARPCRERLEQGLTHRRELRQKGQFFRRWRPSRVDCRERSYCLPCVIRTVHGMMAAAPFICVGVIEYAVRGGARRTFLIPANCVTGKTHLSLAPRAWARVKLTSAAAR